MVDLTSGPMRDGGSAAVEHVEVGVTFTVTATDADTRRQVAGIIVYGEGEERRMQSALMDVMFADFPDAPLTAS